VVGVKLWTALNSTNWRHREAAGKAWQAYMENGMPVKFRNKTVPLFTAAMLVARVLCLDKLL